MFTDFVIPGNNEKEFISMAEKLGYHNLIFLYPFNKATKKTNAVIISKKDLSCGLDSRLVVVKAIDENRAFFNSKKVDIIYGLEKISGKDYLHHKASGMNQVLSKLAKQNNISVGFSISMILDAAKHKKHIIMSRISQNIRFCRKYNVDMITASFASHPYQMRAPKDLISLMQDLGMTGSEARNSLQSTKFKKGLNK